MEDRVAEFTVSTVRVVLPEILPEVAVMVVVPAERAYPFTTSNMARPVLEIVATVVSDEVQVTCVVISLLFPLLYVAVAVNC